MERGVSSKELSNEKLIGLYEATVRETGKKYFESLVLNLSKVLNTYGAWACVYNHDNSIAKSLAFLIAEEFLPEFEYEIKGTPCETVIKNDTLHHIPDNLLEVYPDDAEIKEGLKKPLSYLGVPIKDRDGQIIGNLGVLDCNPMPFNPRMLDIFSIFADRATAELQRLKSEFENKGWEEKFERLLDSTYEAIIELDEDFNVDMVNSSAENMFLCPANHFVGQNFSEFLSDQSLYYLQQQKLELKSKPLGERHISLSNELEIKRIDLTSAKVKATISEFYLGDNTFYTLILIEDDTKELAQNLKSSFNYERPLFNRDRFDSENKVIGKDINILKILNDVKKVAPLDSTVLIVGETGTGKELIAKEIHNKSKRKNKALVKVNCAAIPASLIESEFFGHEKGAFTGATSKREGRFKLADGGTIFLDEIGEMPIDLQPKLLRVLQEGEYEPVGSSKTAKVDVRVIAATNRDLQTEIEKGNFREDLYYRLNVFPIQIPPLRERGEDILLLAEKLADKFSKRLGINIKPLSEKNKEQLLSYTWPGNIRELQNIIERAVITSHNGELDIEIVGRREILLDEETPKKDEKILTNKEIQEIEKNNIIKALEVSGWKIYGEKGAAKLLNIPPTTLSSKMKSLGIKKPK